MAQLCKATLISTLMKILFICEKPVIKIILKSYESWFRQKEATINAYPYQAQFLSPA
jgi:hypothetical protein